MRLSAMLMCKSSSEVAQDADIALHGIGRVSDTVPSLQSKEHSLGLLGHGTEP
jgi:DNA-binding transcriptional regulator LsrR (DeoR family)